MIQIHKGREPRSLTQHRAMPEASYGNCPTPVKDDIRQALLTEQGYLCAYCQQRIAQDNMKIEHFASQSEFDTQDLHYKNMLGCCLGGEGSPEEKQTCDTRKGNQPLKYNPASPPDIATQLRYSATGELYANDTELDQQLNQALNLNFKQLKDNRKATLKAVKAVLNSKKGTRTRPELERLLRKWQDKAAGKLKPFNGIAIYTLQKKLNRL